MLLPCALLRAGKSRRGYMLFRQAGAAQELNSMDRLRPKQAEAGCPVRSAAAESNVPCAPPRASACWPKRARAERIRVSADKFPRSQCRTYTIDLPAERTEFRDPLIAGAGRSALGSWKELWVERSCHWRCGCAIAVREPNRCRARFWRHPPHTGSPAWTAKPRDLEVERPHRAASASPAVSVLPDSAPPQEHAVRGAAPSRPPQRVLHCHRSSRGHLD